MMTPTTKQVEKSDKAVGILLKHNLVYLAMEERTGKSLTALLTADKYGLAKRVLIITKKTALDGWRDTLERCPPFSNLTHINVVNYHQVKKLYALYDLIILDEAHNYVSGFPKQSAMNKEVRKLTLGKPLIYLSATPHAQGLGLLYHQFKLSTWSPFRDYKDYYTFHNYFGIEDSIWVAGVPRETYKKFKDKEVMAMCEHLFVYGTRAEMGIDQEPEDVVHYVQLGETTKQVYNIMIKDRILEINGVLLELKKVAKLRASLHMLEGGVMKVEDEYHTLGNTEKIDYIKSMWGDTTDMVIMHHYKAEAEKLHTHFKNALILQGTSYAEGVDLHKYAHLIIYSQDWSTARHSQRRARQANSKRTDEIKVHFLLCKKAISEEVYTTVSTNKTNYIDSCFKGEKL